MEYPVLSQSEGCVTKWGYWPKSTKWGLCQLSPSECIAIKWGYCHQVRVLSQSDCIAIKWGYCHQVRVLSQSEGIDTKAQSEGCVQLSQIEGFVTKWGFLAFALIITVDYYSCHVGLEILIPIENSKTLYMSIFFV